MLGNAVPQNHPAPAFPSITKEVNFLKSYVTNPNRNHAMGPEHAAVLNHPSLPSFISEHLGITLNPSNEDHDKRPWDFARQYDIGTDGNLKGKVGVYLLRFRFNEGGVAQTGLYTGSSVAVAGIGKRLRTHFYASARAPGSTLKLAVYDYLPENINEVDIRLLFLVTPATITNVFGVNVEHRVVVQVIESIWMLRVHSNQSAAISFAKHRMNWDWNVIQGVEGFNQQLELCIRRVIGSDLDPETCYNNFINCAKSSRYSQDKARIRELLTTGFAYKIPPVATVQYQASFFSINYTLPSAIMKSIIQNYETLPNARIIGEIVDIKDIGRDAYLVKGDIIARRLRLMIVMYVKASETQAAGHIAIKFQAGGTTPKMEMMIDKVVEYGEDVVKSNVFEKFWNSALERRTFVSKQKSANVKTRPVNPDKRYPKTLNTPKLKTILSNNGQYVNIDNNQATFQADIIINILDYDIIIPHEILSRHRHQSILRVAIRLLINHRHVKYNTRFCVDGYKGAARLTVLVVLELADGSEILYGVKANDINRDMRRWAEHVVSMADDLNAGDSMFVLETSDDEEDVVVSSEEEEDVVVSSEEEDLVMVIDDSDDE